MSGYFVQTPIVRLIATTGHCWRRSPCGATVPRPSPSTCRTGSASDIVFDPTAPWVMYAADRFSGVFRLTPENQMN
jgi:hypothetical protein